jgi:hypothetical protein
LTGEGVSITDTDAKKRPVDKYNKIPVFNSASSGIVERTSDNSIEEEKLTELEETGEIEETEAIEPEMETDSSEEDELSEETEAPRYNYIGYSQDYSLDDSQSYVSFEALKKMAMDAYRANNYFLAMQYFNKILVHNPRNKEALFFKKKLLSRMQGTKTSQL